MIPLILPPLRDLTVLVTRPAHQASRLCEAIKHQGGHALALPMIGIEPLIAPDLSHDHDLVILTSSNAVVHGQALWRARMQASFAAIGNSTASALKELGRSADIVPTTANSEALLDDPALQSPRRVLLIRGEGGRTLLPTTLQQRGSHVDIAEVYRRVPVAHDAATRHTLLQEWQDNYLDVVIATSIDILDALHALLLELRGDTTLFLPPLTLLAGSPRIATHAEQLPWNGPIIVSTSPEDEAVLDTLTRWHTRARA